MSGAGAYLAACAVSGRERPGAPAIAPARASVARPAIGYAWRADAAFVVAHRVGVRDVNEVLAVPGEAGAVTPMAGVKCSGGSCSQLMVTGEGTPAQRTRSSQRTEGGLLVEVIEPRSVRVVWRALNTGTVRPGEWTPDRLDAVATQAVPVAGHAYVFGEAGRLARPVAWVARRGVLAPEAWTRWFSGLRTRLGPMPAGGDVAWLARKHDLDALLAALYLEADQGQNDALRALKPAIAATLAGD